MIQTVGYNTFCVSLFSGPPVVFLSPSLPPRSLALLLPLSREFVATRSLGIRMSVTLGTVDCGLDAVLLSPAAAYADRKGGG